MAELAVHTDPVELGFDPARLSRIDRHFQRYVDDGRLPGYLVLVSRDGEIAHLAHGGLRDTDPQWPVTPDTLWRIYSMTKPVTSLAAMMLYEQGAFELTDPIARYLPEFADPRVYVGGSDLKPMTVPATEPIRVWHLLTHTSGLTYGFHHAHPVDALYRRAGFEWGIPKKLDLAGACERWARFPLLFQPGAEWAYSVATDVLGRLIEVCSGQSLDDYLAEHICAPLGMTDTGFFSTDPRLGALYTPTPGGDGLAQRSEALSAGVRRRPTALSGGGGLISSAADYHRFTQLLLRRGELDGVRLLGSRTVDYMVRNQLPGNADLEAFGRPLFAEHPLRGSGFGFGFAVTLDAAAGKNLASEGEFSWGGAASTAFLVDPSERITALFFTQLLPSDTHPIRSQLRTLLYQALVD